MIRIASVALAVILCAGLLFNISPSPDINGGAPGPDASPELPPGWEKLNLTAEQQKQIGAIHAAHKNDPFRPGPRELADMLGLLTEKQRAELVRLDEQARDHVETEPKMFLLFDYEFDKAMPDNVPKIVHGNMNFGVWANGGLNAKSKRLVFGERGQTNNTRFRIDEKEFTFGKPGTGNWAEPPRAQLWENEDRTLLLPSHVHKGATCTWQVKDVRVRQSVRVISGEPVEWQPRKFKRYYDTCEVVYDIENMGEPVEFGMRILLDTLIGETLVINKKGKEEWVGNDGVPFVVPGVFRLLTAAKFTGVKVPPFVMAQEKADIDQPGIVVQLNLRLGGRLESPNTVLLTKWPGNGFRTLKQLDAIIETWDVPLEEPSRAHNGPDSAIAMYWPTRTLKKGELRKLGYTYALVSSNGASGREQLAMMAGGDRVVDGEISIVALVKNATKDETAAIDLPAEFTLIEGPRTQPVPEPMKGEDGKLRPGLITWRVKANAAGHFVVRVSTSKGTVQTQRIFVRRLTIY